MRAFLEDLKKYKFLLHELVKKGFVLKYRRSYLGLFWTLLEPLCTMLVLTIVFGGFFGQGDRLYPVYILSGRLLYTYFNTSTKGCMRSMRKNAGMMKKVYVPKYLYPLSTVLYQYIIFLISLSVLVLIGAIFYHPEKIINTGNGWIFHLNPLYACIDMFRSAIFGTAFHMEMLWLAIGASAVTIFIGAVLFRKNQDRFVLYL